MELDSTQTIRLALPSKGRLQTATQEFLAHCGFDVKQSNTRGYMGSISALPNVNVIFQRPRDITLSVANGGVDLGITGFDVVKEAMVDDAIHVIHDALGFGKCKLVVAVSEKWDARNMSDLQAVGNDWATRGQPLRVATVYPKLTRAFLNQHRVPNVQIVEAEGSLEVLPEINAADLIADIVETGSTLQQNRLRALQDGVMLHTQACLIANRSAIKKAHVLQTAETMLEYIEAHLRAENFFMVIANMRGNSAEDVAHKLHTQTTLGGLQGPTVAPIYPNPKLPAPGNGHWHGGWYGITLMVKRNDLTSAMQQLRAVGGSGVIVTPVAYVFEEQPDRVAALRNLA
jgi:ATP phosphoribosyltransferase